MKNSLRFVAVALYGEFVLKVQQYKMLPFVCGITNTFLFNKQNCKVYIPSYSPRAQGSPNIAEGTNKMN